MYPKDLSSFSIHFSKAVKYSGRKETLEQPATVILVHYNDFIVGLSKQNSTFSR